MDLSITIASYNSCSVTLEALQSIQKETQGIEYEVIVVDNASTDGSADMIAAKFPWVKLIRSPRNLGFAPAHNLALAAAKGDFLLILNSDILFIGNVARQMLEKMRESGDKCGAIGPQIVNPDGTVDPSSRRKVIYSMPVVALTIINQSIPFLKLVPIGFLRRFFGPLLRHVHDNFDPPASVQEVGWLNGMCVMFRRNTLEQSGLFDEQFFFDFEIGDLLIRISKAGWRILFDPTVRIVHLGGYSRKRLSKIIIDSQRSELVYYSKYRPDYLPMLYMVNSLRYWIDIKRLQISRLFSKKTGVIDEKIAILAEVLNLVSEFNPKSALDNQRIPQLGKTITDPASSLK